MFLGLSGENRRKFSFFAQNLPRSLRNIRRSRCLAGGATGEKRAGARMCSCPWRNNYEDKSKHGNLACGENSHISPDESLIKGVTCPVHTPSHSRRLLPRTARLCRLLALGFPRLKQYLIVLASSLRAANANRQCKPQGLHCRVRFREFRAEREYFCSRRL